MGPEKYQHYLVRQLSWEAIIVSLDNAGLKLLKWNIAACTRDGEADFTRGREAVSTGKKSSKFRVSLSHFIRTLSYVPIPTFRIMFFPNYCSRFIE